MLFSQARNSKVTWLHCRTNILFSERFFALEDLQSHNVVKALLATLAKYRASLSDIFYGTFVPPASFRLSVNAAANPLKSSSNSSTSLRELRGDYALNTAACRSSLRPPTFMPVSAAQGPLCRTQISSERPGIFHPRNDKNHSSEQHHSYTPHLDDSSFKPVTLLTRKSSPSPKAHRATQRSSFPMEEVSASQSHVPRKDPSEMWFDCGEELQETEIIPLAPTVPLTFQPDRVLLTDHKLSGGFAANDSPLRQSVFSSADEDGGFTMMPQTLEAVIASECKSPLLSVHQSSTLSSSSSRYNNREQAWARDARIGLIKILNRKKRFEVQNKYRGWKLIFWTKLICVRLWAYSQIQGSINSLVKQNIILSFEMWQVAIGSSFGNEEGRIRNVLQKLCAALLFLGHQCSTRWSYKTFPMHYSVKQ